MFREALRRQTWSTCPTFTQNLKLRNIIHAQYEIFFNIRMNTNVKYAIIPIVILISCLLCTYRASPNYVQFITIMRWPLLKGW